MAVWRLQTKKENENIGDYCLDHHVIALGWSLLKLDQEKRETIKTFDTYKLFADDAYKSYDSIRRLYEDVKNDDLVWMRYKGQYYFSIIENDSKWVFDSSKEATKRDVCNQLTNVFWKPSSEYADEDSVPGAIATAFIGGRSTAFQRIHKEGVAEFSQFLYNKISGTKHYNLVNLKNDQDTFYSMLSPDDCEDLLCMWLYKKLGYICIPSTNKRSTELYECVLVDPSTGNKVYPQVKKGKPDINSDNFKDLKGQVWLLTTEGKITGNAKVYVADPTQLFEFASNESNRNILPEKINNWVSFLKSNQ